MGSLAVMDHRVSQPANDASEPKSAPTTSWINDVPADQLGLRSSKGKREDALVDIVAVHDLAAVPANAWKDEQSGINWLEDEHMLPRLVSKAQIMTFGYNSMYVGKKPIKTSVRNIANSLLESLEFQRRDTPDRPVILIGHGFGGLVIQKAILLSQLRSTPTVNATAGIIFLGTPHRGTETFSDQGKLMAAIMLAIAASPADDKLHIEPGILAAMKWKHENLVDGSADFTRLCLDKQIQLRCFFEQRPSNVGMLVGRTDIREFIVDEASAQLDGHPSFGLPVDHFGLAKYSDPKDGNFRLLSNQVVLLYDHAIQQDRNITTGNYKEPWSPAHDEMQYYSEPGLGPAQLSMLRRHRERGSQAVEGAGGENELEEDDTGSPRRLMLQWSMDRSNQIFEEDDNVEAESKNEGSLISR